jgi:hypothetical protein
VKEESAAMTKWRNGLKSNTEVEEKAWFEEDDNFSADFREKVKKLKQEKDSVENKDVVGVVESDNSINASTGNASITGVMSDGNQSADISSSTLSPSNGSIFGDNSIGNIDSNTTEGKAAIDKGQPTDNIPSNKLIESRSNESIFGGPSIGDVDMSSSEGNMDYSVRDVINAYKEVQIEHEASKGGMIGPIQEVPDEAIMPKSNKVLDEIKAINRKTADEKANISRDMLISSRGYQLKKLENSKAGFAKKVFTEGYYVYVCLYEFLLVSKSFIYVYIFVYILLYICTNKCIYTYVS